VNFNKKIQDQKNQILEEKENSFKASQNLKEYFNSSLANMKKIAKESYNTFMLKVDG
jgi:hypothetical protein